MSDEDGRLRADSRHDRLHMRLDVPRRFVRRGPVPEEVWSQHVEVVECVLREHREVPALARDSMQADDAR